MSQTVHYIQIAVLLLSASFVLADTAGPQQIRIAYGTNPAQTMSITFVTCGNAMATDASCTYKRDGDQWTSIPAQGTVFGADQGNPDGCQYVYRVSLEGLQEAETYSYSCTAESTQSTVFQFKTADNAKGANSSTEPLTFLVYGDMGRDGGSPSLKRLISEVNSDWAKLDGIIHVGDFAYDLHDKGGVRGDEFMERIEPLAAVMPYMTAVGNHEQAYDFGHYTNRFTMPYSEKTYNQLYSWEIGSVHFIAYSTELYWQSKGSLTTDAQVAWLKADIASVDRSRTPWIVAYGHRPMYCSNFDQDDCTKPAHSRVRAGLEKIMYDGGVDLIIEAHEHSYERLWPVYNLTVTQKDYVNPKAPVHLISGAAGCNEADGLCLNPILFPRGDWSAHRNWFFAYGYGHLKVYNSTHMYFDEIHDETGNLLDSVWIVQERHGPFSTPPALQHAATDRNGSQNPRHSDTNTATRTSRRDGERLGRMESDRDTLGGARLRGNEY